MELIARARVAQRWNAIDWPDAEVAVLASGPSLTAAQCDLVKEWRRGHGARPRRVIVVNTTFRLAPWADVLYACDAPWWRVFHVEASATFKGEFWTQDLLARREFGVNRIESILAKGLGKLPGLIHQGGNGGYQAINLAFQAGARRMVLLGFDMHGSHWHGAYANGLPNTRPGLFEQWLRQFDDLAADLRAEGVHVVNCSPGSRLNCFTVCDLADAVG